MDEHADQPTPPTTPTKPLPPPPYVPTAAVNRKGKRTSPMAYQPGQLVRNALRWYFGDLLAWICLIGLLTYLLPPHLRDRVHFPYSWTIILFTLPAFCFGLVRAFQWCIEMTDTRFDPPPGPPRCANCDYDLTGIDQSTCPECGIKLKPTGRTKMPN